MKRRASLAKWKKAASTIVCSECANLPGNLFTIMTSHVGVVTTTNETMPKLSPLKILSQNLKTVL